MSVKPKFVPAMIWPLGIAFVAFAPFVITAILSFGTSHPPSHSPLSRNKMEVAVMSSAIEDYKIDNGNYPSDPDATDKLESNSNFDPAIYVASSELLYRALSGDTAGATPSKRYFDFHSSMIHTSKTGHKYVVDQWGNSYGYSTFKAAHPASNVGNNPTFDLWSTGGGKGPADRQKWTTNW